MKQITWLMLSSALVLLSGSCQEKMETFTIPAGHVGMFGYGSLMSKFASGGVTLFVGSLHNLKKYKPTKR